MLLLLYVGEGCAAHHTPWCEIQTTVKTGLLKKTTPETLWKMVLFSSS